MVAVLSDGTPVDLADSGVNLRVAVRAQHHALTQLLEGLLPRSVDSVARDPIPLCAGVEMMEVERGRCVRTPAAPTGPAKERDRTHLELSAQLDDAGDILCCLACVAKSMTVCPLEAEPPTVERPELPSDHLLRSKNGPAELTGELLSRA